MTIKASHHGENGTRINRRNCLSWKRMILLLLFRVSMIHSLSMEYHSRPETINISSRRRRFVLSKALVFCGSFLGGPSPAVAALEDTNAQADIPTQTQTQEDRRIYRLTSGVQLREVRVGTGPLITKTSETVLLHLRALTRDGSVLFDTRLDQNGSPMLYRLGSSQDFDYFGGDSSERSKVAQGVEDAILSRGTATRQGSEGRQAVEPMRQGGVRLAVVPAPLAYGHAGVSRYDAFRMGLRTPVPRDEVMRYEIELLRCLAVTIETQPPATEASDDTIQAPITTTVEACCTEENFPCKTPKR
jgi:hypothetical protein